MTFHVGQKVVCVDDSNWRDAALKVSRPRAGSVYTIREVYQSWPEFADDGPGFLLEEIRNPPDPRFVSGEVGWRQFRFRPLIERKTNISIFTEMLTPKNVREKISERG